ncbi:MAG: hypothetical protein L3J09_12820 [Flavobacteriaceae bacterium]|nr:hypothetical protein [Flavobacteriaceae bacterium]
MKEGNYNKAIEIYFKSEKMSESIGDKRNQLIAINNIAGCYKEIKKYDLAMEYYQSSLLLSKKIKDYKYEGAANVGIGETYFFKKDYDNALIHLFLAEDILKATEFKSVLHQSYEALAKVYLKKGKTNKARYFSDKALLGIEEVQDNFSKIDILLTNAAINSSENKYTKALNNINKALIISKANGYLDSEKECVIKKIEILKLQNKNNEIIHLYDELLNLKDTILNTENLKSINELEIKYQTEKKEKENLQFKADKAQNELKLEKENRQKWFFGSIALAAILTIVIIVFYTKNRQQKLLYQSQLAIAKAKQTEHQRIATDLHDYKVKTLEEIASELKKEGKEKQLEITITDDGKGFDDVTLGIGFTNMKMRINEINGKIKIKNRVINLSVGYFFN